MLFRLLVGCLSRTFLPHPCMRWHGMIYYYFHFDSGSVVFLFPCKGGTLFFFIVLTYVWQIDFHPSKCFLNLGLCYLGSTISMSVFM